MKKKVTFGALLCAAAMLGALLTGCGDSAKSEWEPVDVKANEAYLFDLNYDGKPDNLFISSQPSDGENGKCVLVITDENDNKAISDDMVCSEFVSAAVVDLSLEDDFMEIFVTVDRMSDDYETHMFRYDGAALTEAPVIPGSYEGCDGATVSIGNSVDILGTWRASREYQLGESFALTEKADSLWNILPGGEELVVYKDMPVRIGQGDDYKDGTLAAGTKITLIATDAESVVYYKTSGGQEGAIDITVNSSGMALIKGEQADEWFEILYYAG